MASTRASDLEIDAIEIAANSRRPPTTSWIICPMHRRSCEVAALYFLLHQSKMPPMRPPVSNAFFCFASRLS
jgi:hypothetical protein